MCVLSHAEFRTWINHPITVAWDLISCSDKDSFIVDVHLFAPCLEVWMGGAVR